MGRGISGLFSGRQGGDKTGKVEATEFFPGKREEHYEDHFEEFDVLLTIDEYEAKAKRFLSKNLTKTTEFFYDVDGVLYRYDKKTNEFGMCRSDGIMITYYLPEDGIKYWYRKVQEYAIY